MAKLMLGGVGSLARVHINGRVSPVCIRVLPDGSIEDENGRLWPATAVTRVLLTTPAPDAASDAERAA